MSEWSMKRFWETTEVSRVEGGYTALLDGRRIMTPNKNPLVVPTQALAEQIALEWDAQVEKVDPLTMPFTRMSNSAMEKVRPQQAEVAEMLSAYGDSDLLCYRADHPDPLVRRQADLWDPMLDWAADRFGVRLSVRSGVMHIAQDADALALLRALVHAMDEYHLAAFHDLVSMTGSLILGLAAADGAHPPEQLWALSRLDETWQEEQWGPDEEATELALRKKGEFLHADLYYRLSGDSVASKACANFATY